MAVVIYDNEFRAFFDDDIDFIAIKNEFFQNNNLVTLDQSDCLKKWKAWIIPDAKEKGYNLNVRGSQVAGLFKMWSYYQEEEYFYGPVLFTHCYYPFKTLPLYSIRRLAKTLRDMRKYYDLEGNYVEPEPVKKRVYTRRVTPGKRKEYKKKVKPIGQPPPIKRKRVYKKDDLSSLRQVDVLSGGCDI
jgi:hypothetical protein